MNLIVGAALARCRWGSGCPEPAVGGLRFCGPHAAFLLDVRRRLEAEEGGRESFRRSIRKNCAFFGCGVPSMPYERFCTDHLGWAP